MRKGKSIAQKMQRFRYFEIYNPELFSEIKTSVDVEYFPRGNDAFLLDFTNIIKQYVNKRVTK